MIAYISISFKKRQELAKELEAIADTLTSLDIQPFIFVDKYSFKATEDREMMNKAMAEIDKCDLLIAETSDKAIGIGIETGYAKARQKPVIYLRQKMCEHSTTMSGISDFTIVYEDLNELRQELADLLTGHFRMHYKK